MNTAYSARYDKPKDGKIPRWVILISQPAFCRIIPKLGRGLEKFAVFEGISRHVLSHGYPGVSDNASPPPGGKVSVRGRSVGLG